MLNNLKKLNGLLLVLLAALTLGGCAGKQLRYVFPPPPEKPRFEFVRNYYSVNSLDKKGKAAVLDIVTGTEGSFEAKTPFYATIDDTDTLYFSDTFQANIFVVDLATGTVRFLMGPEAGVVPYGFQRTGSGAFWVVDYKDATGKGRVLKLDAKGQIVKIIADQGELVKPTYLFLDEAGERLLVTDVTSHAIKILNFDGELLGTLGVPDSPGNKPGYLFLPGQAVIGPDGNFYVADTMNARVVVFTPEGEFVRQIGSRGASASGFQQPRCLMFTTDGVLLVTDAMNAQVKVFTSGGDLLYVLGGSPTRAALGFATPGGIGGNSANRFVVTDIGAKRVGVWQYMDEDYLAKNPVTLDQLDLTEEYRRSLRQNQ